MNKLSSETENPLEVLLLKMTAALLPAFHATGHTPNVITTYSFVCGLASVYCLWNYQVGLFATLFLTSYFFDSMDGQFARAYRMTTRFGDAYDHFTDAVVAILLVWVVCVRKRRPITWQLALLITLGVVLCTIHVGCIQRHKPEDIGWESLDVLAPACVHPEWIHWARFFSGATACIEVVVIVWHLFREDATAQKKTP